MTHKTALYDKHVALGGKMVDFAGWMMPLHYGSQLNEHLQVRQDAGMFDVSHMNVVDINGVDVENYLRYLLANDVTKLIPGKALYSCMLNENGGIIDDLIVYQLAPQQYRLVLNAGTREKDLAWLQKQSEKFAINIQQRADLAIIAIQGPSARTKAEKVFKPNQSAAMQELKPFYAVCSDEFFIARTGYTGEEGYEIILPIAAVQNFWQALVDAGIKPCGLGARDTLRLEAGMSLYGADMDETTTPLEANLAWTVALKPENRSFIGRQALQQQLQAGVKKQLVGLVLTEGGVLRNHQEVVLANGSRGEITSGSFSPTLQYSVAFARLSTPIAAEGMVMVRNKQLPITVVNPPFVRHNKKVWTCY